MKRALLIVPAVVVVAVLAAAGFYLNPNALRARIEKAVRNATGRELTIAGPIRVAWSLTPTIEVDDVSLANAPGFSRPALAHVDRIAAKIALVPLLSHRVEVHGLTLTGPDVLLERDAAGRPNWEISRPAPAVASTTPPAAGGEKFRLEIGTVAVSDAKLAFRGGRLVEAVAPDLTYDPESGKVAGDLVFRGQGVRFEATTTLTPASFALDGLQLTGAQGDIAGHLIVGAGPRPSLRGALSSTHFDLDAFTAPPPPAPPAGVAQPSPAPPPKPPDRLIPDTPIPYAALRGVDADLQLAAAALSWRGRLYTNVVAHVTLQDGRLGVEPVSMVLGDKTLSAELHADAAAQTIAAKLASPGLPAGPVMALLGGPRASGTLDVLADLRGQGATWRAAAAALQGDVGFAMIDGEIDNSWLMDTLRAANLPIAAGGDSKVRCAAVRADIEAGTARVAALTLDTSKLTLEGMGELNLGDETLDLHLRPTLRLGAAVSVPVHVGGTLRSPKLVLDPGALAPGRVGISIGGPLPADPCGPALALARGGQAGPMPASPEPANRPVKPADLLRGLLR